MDFNEFVEKINDYLDEIEIELTDKQLMQFYNYMNLLIEWNRKINLTTIIEPEEIILKKLEKTRKKYPVEKAKGVSTKYNKL